MNSKPHLFVTGATGFLGVELCRLYAEQGRVLHALARAGADRGPLEGLPIRWHAGDLVDGAGVDRALAAAREQAGSAGLDVIHSGALISYATRDRELQERINITGTQHMLRAAARERVRRFLHVSSVVAIGPSPDGRELDERSPYTGSGIDCDYMRTKYEAEQLALAASSSLDVVIANPGAVFGPSHRKSNTVRFLREVAEGRAPAVAPPGSVAVVGVHDTALGLMLALERGRRGERYLLVERCLPTLELFRLLCRSLGAAGPRFAVPKAVWPALVLGARALDALRPLQLTPPQALVMLGHRLEFNSRKAREELGWKPAPFESVLSATIDTLRSRGLLPAP